jgi:threonine/homoserine/homoserine lactone efflux protein
MLYFQVFLIALFFSFVGSIPPGTLNLCVLQLGLQQKTGAALRFALAVSIIEYPYAWIGVVFESWIARTPAIVQNFQLLTAIVMLVMGVFTIWSARKPTSFAQKFNASGFRRGLVLSILNPMAIPFWVGVTAYLRAQGWVDLSTPGLLHGYVFGTSVGAMLLLTAFTFLAARLSGYVQHNRLVAMAPGITLVVLGLYASYRLMVNS